MTVRRDEYMSRIIDEKANMDVRTFINKCGFDGVTHYGFADFAVTKNPYPEVV